MTVTIDKFGRVLIPKKVRLRIGLQAGDRLALEVSEAERIVALHPEQSSPKEKVWIETTESGWPIIHYLDGKVRDFDVVEMIREGREERGRKILGL